MGISHIPFVSSFSYILVDTEKIHENYYKPQSFRLTDMGMRFDPLDSQPAFSSFTCKNVLSLFLILISNTSNVIKSAKGVNIILHINK